MQQTGKVDINETIAAWADIVIKIWREKITELRVYDKGALDESLLQELMRNAGQDIDRIDFSFKLYGQFVDMGVGKELSKGNSGRVEIVGKNKMVRGTARVPKEWYSKKFYGQVMRLRQILMEKYSQAITYNLINTLNEDFDQRYSDKLTANTVSNLRTVRYRQVTNNRSMRNYRKRRGGYFYDGQWKAL